jgi:hypothetical protein
VYCETCGQTTCHNDWKDGQCPNGCAALGTLLPPLNALRAATFQAPSAYALCPFSVAKNQDALARQLFSMVAPRTYLTTTTARGKVNTEIAQEIWRRSKPLKSPIFW